jgi:CRISPR-associated protein Cmr6
MPVYPLSNALVARCQHEGTLRPTCHPGLALDRFVSWPALSGASQGEEAFKRDFFQSIVDLVREHRDGDGAQLLRDANTRRDALIADLAVGGWATSHFDLKQQWRLTSGLGIVHPLEAGFSLDHVLGVPVLPGSALKGLARAWACEDGMDTDLIDLLFGPAPAEDGVESNDDGGACGLVTVFDGRWREWGFLEVDIVNPHYGEYYLGLGNVPFPAEWMAPVPSFFLTSAAGNRWTFALALSGDAWRALPEDTRNALRLSDEALFDTPDHRVPAALLERATAALRDGLMGLGAGAKTATGYGAFVLP